MSARSRLTLVMGVLGIVGSVPVAADQIREVEITTAGGPIRAICTDGPIRVVLLHGDRGSADSWRAVLERLEGRVGACAYERLGAGGEGAVSVERGWFELLDELHDVHLALGVRSGYTLVGQGVGGLYARLYAMDRPLDPGGLLLVDPAHEDLPLEARPGMPSAAWSRWMDARRRPNGDGVREADLARRVRDRRLPDIPVTVITATAREGGDEWDLRFVTEAARRVHASILRGVRSARHIPASSGEEVHREAPDLVAEEIMRMVRMTSGMPR